MTRNVLALFIFLASFSNANGQTPNWQWAKSNGGLYNDAGVDIAADQYGNVYTVGTFHDTVDFDPGAGVYNLISNGSSSSIYLCKLDSMGNFVWARMWTNGVYD